MEKKKITSSLYRLDKKFTEISEELIENGGELTEELEQKIEAAKYGKEVIADNLQQLIRKTKSEDDILSEEIKRLQTLKKARTNAVESLKRYTIYFMERNGINRIETPYTTVSLGKGQESVESVDAVLLEKIQDKVDSLQAELPPYITLDAKVSKTALKEYLKRDGAVIPSIEPGSDIPAAMIVRKPSLLIR